METLTGIIRFVVNLDLLTAYGDRLLLGVLMTAKVIAVSASLGFLLAFPVCYARMSCNPILSNLSFAYVTFFRGTPLLCQLYLFYYGSGEFRPELTDLNLWWFFRDSYYCCVLAFTLNTSAYQSEILRGAISAVPKGQIEAARALGLSPLHIARHIVFPQAMLVALRPLGNELIALIKASALAAIVTLLDLMGQTRFIFARTFDFSIYLYCALIYLACTEAIRRAINALEARLSRHVRIAVIEPKRTAGKVPHSVTQPAN
jgi:polar amino acid transport system permease protein